MTIAFGKLTIIVAMLLALTGCVLTSTNSASAAASPVPLATRCAPLNGVHNVFGRTFTVVLPNRGVTTPLPLMMNIHGAAANAPWQEVTTGTGDAARKGNFIAVFPQAREATGRIWDISTNGVDMQFLVGIINYMKSSGCVNSTRIYVTGFSQGGMLTSQLACNYPNLINRAAPIGGIIPTYNCAKGKPVPMMAVNGTDDSIVLYNGHLSPWVLGFTDKKYDVSYQRSVMAKNWAIRNGCAVTVRAATVTPVVSQTVYNCPAQNPSVMFTIKKGTHSWPGSKYNVPGEPYFDTTGNVLRFFSLA